MIAAAEPLGPGATIVLGIFVLVFGVVVVVGIKDRLLGRLALREGMRRPGQTLLVIGGLMVGAASITAASIGIDSARDSAVANAYRSWNQVDVVASAGDQPFPESVADELRTELGSTVDGVQPAIELFGSVINKTRKQSNAGVRLVSFDPTSQAAFGEFILADGSRTTGEDLGTHEVFVSRKLAEDLDIQVGDELKMGVAPLVELDPTPKEIGEKLRDTADRLKELEKDAKKSVEKAASRAAEHAAKSAAASAQQQITTQLEAQGQAVASAYLAQISAFQAGLEQSVANAAEAEADLGLPPGSIPPFLSEPVAPVPPSVAPPDTDAITEQITAVAQSAAVAAAEKKAQQVGRRWGRRADQLVRKLENLKDDLDDTIDSLKPPILKVAGVARSEGPGAYGLSSAVFAPLPLVQDMASTNEITSVRFSGHGDERTGLDDVNASLPEIRMAVEAAGVDLEFEDSESLKLREVKTDEVASARDSSEFTVALLGGMSVLVLAAGVALVVNLVQMLAEERRSRLGILRAMGLRRGGLIKLSTLEGAFYSLLAAGVGTFLGIFAGRVLAERFGQAFAGFFGADVDYRFNYSIRPQTLMTSFALGALITLATVFFSAWKTSRMQIPAAIRNLPEPPHKRRLWMRILLWVLGLLYGLGNLAGANPAGKLMGGVAVAVVLFAMLKGKIPERLRRSVEGVALAGWAFFMVWQTSGEDDANLFFAVFSTAVIIAVIGLALAIAANLRIVERVVTGVAGLAGSRFRAGLVPPMAYLSRRVSRTSLSIMMFAVVMAIISMSSVFLYVFQPNYEKDSKGFDIVLTNSKKEPTKVPQDLEGDVVDRADLAVKVYTGSLDTTFQDFEQVFAPLYYITDEQFADPPFTLAGKDESFATNEDALEAVRTDPTWVISNFGQAGDEIVVQDADGNDVTFKIAASPAVGMFDGIMGTEEKFVGLDTQGKGNSSLLAVVPGKDVKAVAAEIESYKYNDGVTTEIVRDQMEAGYRANKTFFSIIDILMRMGLVVGILSLGILGLRAIIERRHLIGVMRAMGFFRRAVMGGLLIEAFATTVLGLLVGLLTGLVMGYIFFLSFFEDSVFGVESEDLWSAVVLVFVAVFLVTIGPAWRASRLPPAEAVRYTE